MTLLCGTKGGADMFPPTGPIVRTGDFQSADGYHVRYNGENSGKLFIQNYAMGAAFMANGKKEDVAGGTKEMEAWFNAIRGKGELVVKPEQAYVVTRILEAIYQSAASGEIVKF
jgi:predicted dehydrogenase